MVPAHHPHGTSCHLSQPVWGSRSFWNQQTKRRAICTRENSRVLKGFSMSQQNSRSLWRSDNTQCRELMGASSPAPSGVTAAKVNWILFARGNKQHFGSCPNQHPQVCVEKRFPSAAPGALLTFHLPVTLPAELPQTHCSFTRDQIQNSDKKFITQFLCKCWNQQRLQGKATASPPS